MSFERVRLYLERHPDLKEFSKIDYHDGYVGEDWPHRGYALARKDIEDLLEDCEEYQSETMAAKEAFNNLVKQKQQWAKDRAEVERLTKMIHSMQFNGARHWFAFAYQRWSQELNRFVDYCRECNKDKEHPAHFAQGSRYLDSRVVERASEKALERVERFLKGLNVIRAREVAKELLEGLPYIDGPEEGV